MTERATSAQPTRAQGFASGDGFGMLPGMSIRGCLDLHGAARAALGLLVVASSGCAYGELPQVLRAQVASETKCADISVRKTSPYAPGYKENQYRIKGCGIDRVYTCKPDEGLIAYGDSGCTYVAGASKVKPPAPAPVDSTGLDDELPTPNANPPESGGDQSEAPTS